MAETQNYSQESGSQSKEAATLQSIVGFLTVLVENVGWSGAVLFLGFAYVVIFATQGQKEAIIDLYVLGKGVAGIWVHIVLAGVFLLTIFAQRRFYKKSITSLKNEVERIGNEKSALQDKLIDSDLNHAETKTKIGGE